MDVNFALPFRRSPRLRNFDYASNGAYFVTVCTSMRACVLSDIVNEETTLTRIGVVADQCWRAITTTYTNISIDTFVVMPNHLHGIIVLSATTGAMNRAPTLGEIVRSFKARTSREINRSQKPLKLWQRNYHERVIRNEKDLYDIRQYILDNPKSWSTDSENPLSK